MTKLQLKKIPTEKDKHVHYFSACVIYVTALGSNQEVKSSNALLSHNKRDVSKKM